MAEVVWSESHPSATAKVLLHKISRWHHDGPTGFLTQPLECDNSLFGGILSQVSTSQSSNVAVKNCFLSITEYRNFTLSFTLVTLLPLKISYLNNSVTEMPDNLSFFGQVHRNHSKSLCHLCYPPWYEFCDYNLTDPYERQKWGGGRKSIVYLLSSKFFCFFQQITCPVRYSF